MSRVAARLRAAWAEMYGEQRLAAAAALGLIASMFLPWYQQTGFVAARGTTQKVSDSLIAFQAWSFVEASILLVALAVLALVFARGERRAFHLPFGDGVVILAAGAWTMFLVFYRQIDKPDGAETGALKTTVGVSWGIFVAFLFGALLAYAGWRLHARQRPEPLVDGDDPRTERLEGDPTSVAPREPDTAVTRVADPGERPTAPLAPDERPTRPMRAPAGRPRPRQRRREDGQFEGQMSFDDEP
jgi:hypothetical protein